MAASTSGIEVGSTGSAAGINAVYAYFDCRTSKATGALVQFTSKLSACRFGVNRES